MDTNPIRDVDLRTRALAQDLVATMRYAVLSVFDAPHGAIRTCPRIAAQSDLDGTPLAFLSRNRHP